jgi:hypothetical protein
MTDKAQHFFQITKTVLEMLRDRGYNIPVAEMDMTLEEFRQQKGDNPNRGDMLLVYRKPNSTEQIMVFFGANGEDPSKALGVKEVTECVRLHNLAHLQILQTDEARGYCPSFGMSPLVSSDSHSIRSSILKVLVPMLES